MKKNYILHFLVITLVCLLGACGKSNVISDNQDSAPNKSSGNVDVDTIPNAVPKNEPRSRYGNPKSYVVFGKRYYVMDSSQGFSERGIASWYGTKFHGKRTSSGETYDMYAMTAAHKNLPLPTYVQVTNLNNGKQIVVKVNDRGPFHENRIIDLSYTAAIKLDIVRNGTGLVEIRAINPGEPILSNPTIGAPVETVEVKNKDGSFYIQVGSFGQLSNAESLRQRLSPLGENLVKISQVIVDNVNLYRVRIGPLYNVDSADSIVNRLPEFGIHDHNIVIN